MAWLHRPDIEALAKRLASHAGIVELKQSESADLALAAAALNGCLQAGYHPIQVPDSEHPTRAHPDTD